MMKIKSQKYKIAETISIIAHRLKNPIAVIKGYLEALLEGDCGEINQTQKEYLGDALLNVKEMSKTLDSLIDASRIDAKEYKLNIQSVDMSKLADEIMQGFYIWAKAANCEISFKKDENIPLVMTDPVKIKQVMDNFIANAIKYNHGKGVVSVSLLFQPKNKEILFQCQDNGIGIAKEDYKKVFTKFYRSQEAIAIDSSGAGLSLFISKAIIELSGGKIWFTKNTGKNEGTIFSFSLPVSKI